MATTDQKNRFCPNCHYPLPGYGTYCTNCSQKHTDGKIGLRQLFSEFFDAVFNLDNRVFRTIRALLVPGKLTLAYFQGRQQRYIRPIRLFFVAAVVLFSLLAFGLSDVLENVFSETTDRQRKEAYRAEFTDQLALEADSVMQAYRYAAPLPAAMDSLLHAVATNRSDSLNGMYLHWNKAKSSVEVGEVNMAMYDIYQLPQDSLFDKYDIQGAVPRWQIQQLIKLNKRGGSFAEQAIGQQVWTYLLLIPAIALFMKVLYVRRKRYFVEHLVFNLHFHTALFLYASVLFVMYLWTEHDIVWILLGGGVLLYLYLALRRYYGQGWMKTFVKFLLYNFVYLLLYTLFLSVTFVLSALTF